MGLPSSTGYGLVTLFPLFKLPTMFPPSSTHVLYGALSAAWCRYQQMFPPSSTQVLYSVLFSCVVLFRGRTRINIRDGVRKKNYHGPWSCATPTFLVFLGSWKGRETQKIIFGSGFSNLRVLELSKFFFEILVFKFLLKIRDKANCGSIKHHR